MAKARYTLRDQVSLLGSHPAASAIASATPPGLVTCLQLKVCTKFCALQVPGVLALAAVPYGDTPVIAVSASGIPVPLPDVLALADVPYASHCFTV